MYLYIQYVHVHVYSSSLYCHWFICIQMDVTPRQCQFYRSLPSSRCGFKVDEFGEWSSCIATKNLLDAFGKVHTYVHIVLFTSEDRTTSLQ